MTRHTKTGIVLFAALADIFLTFFFPPIPQDSEYFNFADQRSFLNIPNFADVASNLPFSIVGISGLLVLRKHWRDKTRFESSPEAAPFLVAFTGLLLLGPGSVYFHWTPSNDTLVWDRLPMTLIFVAFFSTVIAERIHLKAGLCLLPILLVAGIGSVVYWDITESQGRGDLRPYALVQFLPVLLIPVILLLFKPGYTGSRYLVAMIAAYGLAKFFELYDREVYIFTHHLMSGHTSKHLVAAFAAFGLVKYIRVRRKIGS